MLECERDLIKENRYDKKDSKRLKRIAYKLGFCEEKKEIYKEKADKQTVIVDQSQTNNTLQFNKSKPTKTDINVQDVKVLSDNQKTTSKQPTEKKPTNTKKPLTKKKPTKPKK